MHSKTTLKNTNLPKTSQTGGFEKLSSLINQKPNAQILDYFLENAMRLYYSRVFGFIFAQIFPQVLLCDQY